MVFIACSSAPGHVFNTHPEHPRRVVAIEAALEKDSELQPHLQHIHDIPTISDADLEAVHTREYLDHLHRQRPASAGDQPIALRDPEDPDGPTYATSTTYKDALHATSSAVALVKAVASSSATAISSSQPGCSFCRPPGHHATANEFMGFCLINSVAVAARYAQNRLHLNRIAILDWDVHHGNGTSNIFAEDSSVLFIDMHREGVWPGSGTIEDIGHGPGAGYTINIPLPESSGHAAAVAAVEDIVLPALRRFQPDLILISAGFDAHYKDPLECLQFQSATYHTLARMLFQAAEELCLGRCVVVLEGGYDPEAVAEAALETTRALAGLDPTRKVLPAEEMPAKEPDMRAVQAVLEKIKAVHER